jgi:outer membrane lipoprotein-sorting protein
MKAKLTPFIATVLLFQFLIVGSVLAQQDSKGTKAPAKQAEQSETKPSELSAEEILNKMVSAYAECKSYKDEGEVTIVFLGKDQTFTDHRPFTTSFVRPKLFRFEFKIRSGPGFGPWQRYVVWADGKKIRSWWTVTPQVKEFESIERALAGPTGVSGGSAATIPAVLIPGMKWGGGLKRLRDARLLGEEKVDDADCYKIEATPLGERGSRKTLWIDKQTFLVRKIFGTTKLPSLSTEETTTYKPQVNIDIPAKEFTFEPPTE